MGSRGERRRSGAAASGRGARAGAAAVIGSPAASGPDRI
jgi:hypothetical protein